MAIINCSLPTSVGPAQNTSPVSYVLDEINVFLQRREKTDIGALTFRKA